MNRPSAVRLGAACAAAASLLLLSAAGPAMTSARAPYVPRSTDTIRHAGERIGPESEPDAVVDANVADLPAADNQHSYAMQAAALPGAFPGLKWQNIGPYGQDDPADSPNGGLRFARNAGMGVAIAVDPRDATGKSFYVGNMGGLWYTTDDGAHWTPLSDGKLSRSAVGAIAIDPADPESIYVGTGIGYLTSSGDAPGSGIWVSHNAGQTFTRPAQNIRGYAVNAIRVTSDGVVAATSNGLYVSTNDGASFTRVVLPDNLTHDGPATGAYAHWVSDVTVNPLDKNEVIAAVGLGVGRRPDGANQPLSKGNGLYKSTSGIDGPYTYLASSDQLQHDASSNDPIGRVMFSWVKDPGGDSTVLWTIVSDAGLSYGLQPGGDEGDLVGGTTGESLNATNTQLNGIYRSEDAGANWTLKGTPQSIQSSVNSGLGVYPALGYGIGVQGYYNLWIQADPRDTDQVYFGLEEVFQSVANTGPEDVLGDYEIIQRYWDVCGSTTYLENIFKGQSCPDQTPYYGGVSTHPDQHVGAVLDVDGTLRLYTGNDGGFFRQDSHTLTDGRNQFDNDNWTEMNTLATVQPWKIARKPDGEVLTALQDNGSGFFAPGGTGTLVGSGDGVNVVATPDPDVWYMSAQGAIIWVTTDHGKTIRAIPADLTGATFLSPLAIDPTDENHLAVAGQDVHETTKGSATTSTIDPLLYTVVQTDWKQSFDAGAGDNGAYQSQALVIRDTAIYDAICSLCRNTLGDPTKVGGTVATNVKPGCERAKGSTACWHVASGNGLPHNGIWNLAIDPADVNTIYVVLNNNSQVGYDPAVGGNQRVMVSHDAGESFKDITGNLPKAIARDVVVRGNSLIVSTDNGVFTAPKTGGSWMRVGFGLPQTRVHDLDLDSTGRYLTASVYGRGVWVLDFKATSSSSSGPGPKGEPTKPTTAGRGIPATGANAAVGVLAVLFMAVALGVRRFGRRSV